MENGKQPAFQTSIGMSNSEMEHMGLTKREYFAGLAMQGLISGNATHFSDIPEKSIMFADEMLDELEKTKQQ
jgi:hypothetical protein